MAIQKTLAETDESGSAATPCYAGSIMADKGPMYGAVELIDALPMQPGRPDGMRQAMPSQADLYEILQDHPRVVAGYEVLLSHFLRAVELYRRIDGMECQTERHIGTGDPHYLFAVPCEDYAELSAILDEVKESVPA